MKKKSKKNPCCFSTVRKLQENQKLHPPFLPPFLPFKTLANMSRLFTSFLFCCATLVALVSAQVRKRRVE